MSLTRLNTDPEQIAQVYSTTPEICVAKCTSLQSFDTSTTSETDSDNSSNQFEIAKDNIKREEVCKLFENELNSTEAIPDQASEINHSLSLTHCDADTFTGIKRKLASIKMMEPPANKPTIMNNVLSPVRNRQRAATISDPYFYSHAEEMSYPIGRLPIGWDYYQTRGAFKSPLSALTMLATLVGEEVDVAKSLSELSCSNHANDGVETNPNFDGSQHEYSENIEEDANIMLNSLKGLCEISQLPIRENQFNYSMHYNKQDDGDIENKQNKSIPKNKFRGHLSHSANLSKPSETNEIALSGKQMYTRNSIKQLHNSNGKNLESSKSDSVDSKSHNYEKVQMKWGSTTFLQENSEHNKLHSSEAYLTKLTTNGSRHRSGSVASYLEKINESIYEQLDNPYHIGHLSKIIPNGFNAVHTSGLDGDSNIEAISGNYFSFNAFPRYKSDPLSIVLRKFKERTKKTDCKGYIGIYSPEDRKARVERFLEKRKCRLWTKTVKYDVRKNFADSRIRVKGRFVRKDDEVNLTSESRLIGDSSEIVIDGDDVNMIGDQQNNMEEEEDHLETDNYHDITVGKQDTFNLNTIPSVDIVPKRVAQMPATVNATNAFSNYLTNNSRVIADFPRYNKSQTKSSNSDDLKIINKSISNKLDISKVMTRKQNFHK